VEQPGEEGREVRRLPSSARWEGPSCGDGLVLVVVPVFLQELPFLGGDPARRCASKSKRPTTVEART